MDKQEVVRMYQSGKSVVDVGFAFGISKQRVSQILREQGCPARPPGATARGSLRGPQVLTPAQHEARKKGAAVRQSTDTYFRIIARRSQPVTAEQFALISPLIDRAILLAALDTPSR